MTGPLSGIRIVEFTGLGPAPLAGQLLADMGAEVIAIDRKSAPKPDTSDVNRRGKRSIALDLKKAEARDIVLKLLAEADVLIEGFRPGVMEKLSLGPKDVPDHLIYSRMTGWGQEGPLSQTAGHDLTYLALTGTLNMFGAPDRPPHSALNYVADFGGGAMFLVFGILTAIIERSHSGRGQTVDAAMIDGVAAMGGLINSFLAQGVVGEARGQNFLDGSAPFYRTYECADGKFVAVGCLEPQFFARFLDLGGLPAEDAQIQNDRSAWPEMHARYESHFKGKTRDDWAAIYQNSDACVAPVLALSEAQVHPHMAERGIYRTIENTVHPAPAPRFSRSKSTQPMAPNQPGGDTDSVLRDLGFTQSDVDALRKDGALT